jgi:hypothetical protein
MNHLLILKTTKKKDAQGCNLKPPSLEIEEKNSENKKRNYGWPAKEGRVERNNSMNLLLIYKGSFLSSFL